MPMIVLITMCFITRTGTNIAFFFFTLEAILHLDVYVYIRNTFN